MNTNHKNSSISDKEVSTGIDARSPEPVVKPDSDSVVAKSNAIDSSEQPPLDVDPTGSAMKPVAKEIGGTNGPEPTRYGDWEHKGRCYDF